MAKKSRKRSEQQYPWEQIEGATGASDSTSGGGAGAGTPEPETVEGSRGRVLRGNPKRDKEKLFPEKFGRAKTKRTSVKRVSRKSSAPPRAKSKSSRTRKSS